MEKKTNDAAAVRRLMTRREALAAEIRSIDGKIAFHGDRLSRANGLIVPLRGPALLRLAEGGR